MDHHFSVCLQVLLSEAIDFPVHFRDLEEGSHGHQCHGVQGGLVSLAYRI